MDTGKRCSMKPAPEILLAWCDDADRRNAQHSGLEPVRIPLDLGPDVEWRRAAEDAATEDEDS
jgi:hypothetical protein